MYSQGGLARRAAPLSRVAGQVVLQWPRNLSRTCSRSLSSSSTIQRLSRFWIPTVGAERSRDAKNESHELLIRAGYVRQAHAGIFHMLPLGNRVQQKLEALIDKHMESIGAAKVSLSTISSEELWKKTGRFVGHGGELFGFHDRKDAKFLLSPTHEEEITSLVASTVQSYKDLPLRLYQIGRKFRDEARPRQGLLRGREFTMKDLYTFDITEQQARQTYEEVRQAYRAFLDELKLPYLVAEADSGNIGGTLSHEYHFVSAKGEDNVISCSSCGHTINDELAITSIDQPSQVSIEHKKDLSRWVGITKDRNSLVVAWFPTTTQQSSASDNIKNEINPNVIKALVPDIDLSVENPLEIWDKTNPRQETGSRPSSAQIIEINDERLPLANQTCADIQHKLQPRELLLSSGRFNSVQFQLRPRKNGKSMQLTRTLTGDPCQKCGDGKVTVDRAIEVGHTFHLGTRYSLPLSATFVDSNDVRKTIEMGCHGIGVSRLVGAIASMLSDAKGLNWPAVIAPFSAVVVPANGNEDAAEDVTKKLLSSGFDAVLDDRKKPMGWKLNDADLVGYPLIVVLGRAWKTEGKVEVQCRRLGIKEEVQCGGDASSGLEQRLQGLLMQL
ncbi:prolyl-tRNA synthetase [Aureobasidium sp. EXF-10727]|nr:prolyl-tRNA synthetase [Aureobasidium sp. EXF-10727]